MWKQFLGKLSWKSPKSGMGGGSPPGKSPPSYGANGREAELLGVSLPPPASPAACAGAEGETRDDVFPQKLIVCCVVFDFSAERGRDSPDRERKRQVLMSLVDCVGAVEEPLTEPMVSACLRMLAINLFRVFPPKVRLGAAGAAEADEDEPFFDPSWPPAGRVRAAPTVRHVGHLRQRSSTDQSATMRIKEADVWIRSTEGWCGFGEPSMNSDPLQQRRRVLIAILAAEMWRTG